MEKKSLSLPQESALELAMRHEDLNAIKNIRKKSEKLYYNHENVKYPLLPILSLSSFLSLYLCKREVQLEYRESRQRRARSLFSLFITL